MKQFLFLLFYSTQFNDRLQDLKLPSTRPLQAESS